MTALLTMLSLLITVDPAGDPLDKSGSPNAASAGIELWVDKDEPVYHPGEKLKVSFRTDRDCYVAVYDIEVSGEKTMIFPRGDEDGWVRAGEVYEIPPASADFDYVVTGPAGTETIVLLAGDKPRPRMAVDEEYTTAVVRKSLDIEIEEPPAAKLRLLSRPPHCRIYIEEVASGRIVFVGKTPRTIEMRPGRYVVRIKKTGYETLARLIDLEPGDRRRVFVELWGY